MGLLRPLGFADLLHLPISGGLNYVIITPSSQHPAHHQRPAPLERAGLQQPRDPDAQPRPAGRAGHDLRPRLLPQPHLHAHARLDHHRHAIPASTAPTRWAPSSRRASTPSARTSRRAGYRTALVGKAHFQPLQGTEEYPSLESYPILQDLDFWRDFHGPFYGFEHVELARNHTDEAHVGQHYALWMEEKGCDNWRDYFRPPTGNNDSQIRTWADPGGVPLRRLDRRAHQRADGRVRRERRDLLPLGQLLRPAPPYLVPEPWDTMYDPDKLTVPADHAGRAREQPAPLPDDAGGAPRLLRVAGAGRQRDARLPLAPARPRRTGEGHRHLLRR